MIRKYATPNYIQYKRQRLNKDQNFNQNDSPEKPIRKVQILWKKFSQTDKLRPNAIENCTIVKIGYKIYLYGGKYTRCTRLLFVFNLRTKIWKILQPKRFHPEFSRNGHTCNKVDQKTFLIFGGEKFYKNPIAGR